jgi:putative membrane protein
MGGLTEIALGKLAVEKGSSDAVKQFGQKMIDDHTKANDELKQLAAAGGVNVPDALDSKHQARVEKLARLSGVEFDKAYIKDQMKHHQQNVKDFQQEAQYGSVEQVKNLASKSLPTLQEHVELAKDLNKSKK